MPVYPPLQQQEPRIYSQDDFAAWEAAMQQIAVANNIIQRMERCKMPCDAQRNDCDGLCEFFQALAREWRGHSAPVPHQ